MEFKADVLETQFAELENNIKMTKDFEQIRYTHDSFLSKIQFQSFILNKAVSIFLKIFLNFNEISVKLKTFKGMELFE
jgi:hypothetical protein